MSPDEQNMVLLTIWYSFNVKLAKGLNADYCFRSLYVKSTSLFGFTWLCLYFGWCKNSFPSCIKWTVFICKMDCTWTFSQHVSLHVVNFLISLRHTNLLNWVHFFCCSPIQPWQIMASHDSPGLWVFQFHLFISQGVFTSEWYLWNQTNQYGEHTFLCKSCTKQHCKYP